MTQPRGWRLPSGGRTPIDVPVVTVEVVDGAVTPTDVAYAVDQLQRTCAEVAGRVRSARARLFGPDHRGVTYAEATLILTGGLTLSESGRGTTPRRAVDALAADLAAQLASHRSRRVAHRHGSV
jgi:hypothetical protein